MGGRDRYSIRLERYGGEADALGQVDFAARAAKVGDAAPESRFPD